MVSNDARKAIDMILTAPADSVAELVAEWRQQKQLSVVVHELNTQILAGAPDQKSRAEQALSALGFVAS
jgi:hypothetical protein